jgi:hypothetical protein
MALGHAGFMEVPSSIPPAMAPSGPVPEIPVWLVSADGTVLDTVVNLSTRHEMAVLISPDTPADGRIGFMQVPQPFADQPLWAVDPTGRHTAAIARHVASAAPASFAVHWISLHGDTVETKQYPYAPVSTNPDEIEAIVADFASKLSTDSEKGAAAVRDALYLPKALPPVSDMVVGVDGSIWIARERLVDSSDQQWQVVGPDGELLGAVALPDRLTLRTVRGVEGWATGQSSDGSTEVWRVRLER